MVAAVTVRRDGFAEHAFVGEVGWHGLGNELKAGAKIEKWVESAGMDWSVNRGELAFTNADGEIVHIDGQKALHRSDDNGLLGIVSDGYKIVQPGEVLEFFRDLCDHNGFSLNTAGTLFGGKRFWGLASIGEDAVVLGDDRIKGYLLLASSADGSLATTAQFTTIRVVCNNTLGMALGQRKKGAGKVAVSHRSVFKPENVKTDLGIVRDNFKEFTGQARALAKAKISKTAAEKFIASLLTDSKTIASAKPDSTRSYQAIMELFEGGAKGSELKGVSGTAWGLVNSVTEYVDHHARAKSLEHRMSDAFFGRGDQLKSMAFGRAMELIDA